MANFPINLDDSSSLPNPTGTNTQNNPDHASLHTQENAAIIAAETKLGIGSSTPASNTLLVGTGSGTSAWQGLTSAQLASVLSDETGTGSNVFANTPTLITPKVDTINENTLNNGVTIDSLNIKDGALNTNNSVVTSNITDSSVTAAKLSSSAIKLGYAQITSDFTTTSASLTDVTGLSVTVTAPGSRDLEITVFCGGWKTSGGPGTVQTAAIVESSTILNQTAINESTAGYNDTLYFSARAAAPSAGSHTYKIQVAVSSGTLTFQANTAGTVSVPGAAYIMVKAI